MGAVQLVALVAVSWTNWIQPINCGDMTKHKVVVLQVQKFSEWLLAAGLSRKDWHVGIPSHSESLTNLQRLESQPN